MLIAVIGDTHLRKHTDKIDSFINKEIASADMVIHTGDYTSVEVIDKIKASKRFVGVFGNNDKGKLRSLLKEKEILSLEGFKIGICHGDGPKKLTIDNTIDTFKDHKLDLIIYGHSHKPSILTKGKTIYINPGSLTSKRKEPYHSYILINLCHGKPMDITFKFF